LGRLVGILGGEVVSAAFTQADQRTVGIELQQEVVGRVIATIGYYLGLPDVLALGTTNLFVVHCGVHRVAQGVVGSEVIGVVVIDDLTTGEFGAAEIAAGDFAGIQVEGHVD